MAVFPIQHWDTLTVIGVLILILAWLGVGYILRDKRRAEFEEADEEVKEEEEDWNWSEKFDEAAKLVEKIGPKSVSGMVNAPKNGFEAVFPSERLRERIELDLVDHDDSRNWFLARSAIPVEVERVEVQETITEVFEAVEKFKKEYPEAAKQLGI